MNLNIVKVPFSCGHQIAFCSLVVSNCEENPNEISALLQPVWILVSTYAFKLAGLHCVGPLDIGY